MAESESVGLESREKKGRRKKKKKERRWREGEGKAMKRMVKKIFC